MIDIKNEEKALIATLFFSGIDEIKNKIKNVPNKYFCELVQKFFKDYKLLELKGLPIDTITEKEEYKELLNNSFDYGNEFFEQDVDRHIRSLELDYIRERIINTAGVEKYKLKDEIAELYSEIMRDTETKYEKANLGDIETIFNESLTENDNVKTGEVRFDNYVKFTKRDLHVIGARPGVGKSAFALYLTLMMIENSRGLFFSLEMPLKQIFQRIVSSQTKTALEDFKNLNDDKKQIIKKCFDKYKNNENLKFYDGNFKIEQIEELVKLEKEINGLDFIIVDYLQLIKGNKGSRYELITEISIRLKQIAKDYDIAVIALSQLSREIEKRADKEIYLADFRESGQIEQDASTILGLSTEETSIQNKHLMKVQILKNRQGRLGVMKFDYYKNNQTFYKA